MLHLSMARIIRETSPVVAVVAVMRVVAVSQRHALAAVELSLGMGARALETTG